MCVCVREREGGGGKGRETDRDAVIFYTRPPNIRLTVIDKMASCRLFVYLYTQPPNPFDRHWQDGVVPSVFAPIHTAADPRVSPDRHWQDCLGTGDHMGNLAEAKCLIRK